MSSYLQKSPRINEFSNVVGYTVNTEKSVVFLHIKKEIKN